DVPSKVFNTGTSDSLTTSVIEIGCNDITVKATDPACGRWNVRSEETVVEPKSFGCAKYWNFINPVPDVKDVRAVAGLTGLPTGHMKKPRRMTMNVLVVHPGACSNDPTALEPEPEDVQFRLAWFFIGRLQGLDP